MKLLHLADLHIGKMLYGYSLLEDQAYLFENIYQMIEEEKIDIVIIAGDVYDRAVPSAQAVDLLDAFLDHLINVNEVKVLMISGNHDSASRLNFGSRILEKKGLYIVTEAAKKMTKLTFEDEHGAVHFYLLPYVTRSDLKHVLDIQESKVSMDDLMKQYMAEQTIDFHERNVLVGHLTCIGGQLNGEEVGGLEWVSPDCFSGFDYVALGHLHAWHRVNQKEIYYAGSPLRLSIDEAKQKKGWMLVELADKGMIRIETLPVNAKRELLVKEGYLAELLEENNDRDYVFLLLKDENLQVNAADRARHHYPYLLGLSYEHLRTVSKSPLGLSLKRLSQKTPLELFSSFYQTMKGVPIDTQIQNIFEQYFGKEGEHED